ncbi:MAG TPA: DUF624 domain-containing protein [Anaerolineales bacterium]|nr:DUF624 domain-containing protein [Anaerolineales bacterium]
MNLWHIFKRSIGLWWDNWIGFLLCSLIWLFCQFLVIPAPPATVALYAIAEKIVNNDPWDIRLFWQTLRKSFRVAWQWALPNGFLLLVLYLNFLFFNRASSENLSYWRVAWFIIGLFWVMVNMLYWPFWHIQQQKKMSKTYANCLRFISKHRWQSIFMAVILTLIGLLALAIVAPLALGVALWLAVVASEAVRISFNAAPKKPLPASEPTP